MKISILICTMPSRASILKVLIASLIEQSLPYDSEVEILWEREDVSIGAKRNILLSRATGEYLCFLDDDDKVSLNYIELLMKAAESGCDCASLKGMYSINGNDDGIFEHSLKYKKWETVGGDIKYLRFPNHLNLIKSSIAKQFQFPKKNHGEDFDWSTAIHKAGVLKTEYYIPDIIYYYRYISNKMKYSQSDEEIFIEDYFSDKPIGKFLDVGAYDVFRFSNVRALYNKGWSGVLVEPAPKNFRAIADHYKEDSRIEVLNVAIGEETASVDFYESDGDAVSTTDENHMKKWAVAGVNFTKIRVPQMSVSHFINQYGKGTNMISIDTEATNINIFRLIEDWFWEQVSLVVIEHDQHQEEIETKLIPFGFSTLYVNAENIILAR